MRLLKILLPVIMFSALLMFIPASRPQSDGPPKLFNLNYNDNLFIDSVLSSMSLKEKCAQLVMPNANGVDTNSSSPSFQRLKKFVDEYKVGGIIFFKGGAEKQAIITNKLQAASKLPLLIASDFERGLGMRLEDEIEFPYNMAFAAAGDPINCYFAGKFVSERSRALGVRQNYAPLMDINRDPRNPVINIRSYSDNPETAALYGSYFIKGLRDGKMISTAKHFPGHGATNLDSHNDLPLISLTKEELRAIDLFPFERAIKNGVQSIMIGHLEVPSFDSTKNLPATFSKNIVTELLINELNFSGLIVTDALNMKAITDRYTQEEAAKLAILAGNDVLLYPENEEKVINGILAAVASGEVTEERINRSVRKILAAKKFLGLFENRFSYAAGRNLNTTENSLHRFAYDVASKSITLLKDEKNIIPINSAKYKSVVCIALSNSKKFSDADAYFGNEIKKQIKNIKYFEISGNSKDKELKKVLTAAKRAQLIIIPAFVTVKSSPNSISLSDKDFAFLKSIIALKKPSALISFGTPYLISGFMDASAYLCAYGNPRPSQEAALDALLGKKTITGRLPITIPDTDFNSGSGLKRITRLYTASSPADTLYDFSKLDTLMNAGVREKAFPGGVLLVGHNGKIVYNKAFGNYTYDKKSKKVTVNSLFDLASLTKVTATAPAAMLLVDAGLLSLDDKVIQYLPEFNNNGKENITIRNLLLHNSGLPAFKPYYKTCKNAKEELNEIMNASLENAPGSKFVYSDLGMIVLQKVIEKIAGMPLDKYLKKNLYDKLEMKNTFFNPPRNRKADCMPTELDNYWRNRLIQGEVHDETASMLNGVAGNAGLFSTASDIAVLINVLINKGICNDKTIFKSETIDAWTKREGKQSSRALGWDTKIDDKSSAGTLFSTNSFGHTGFTGTSIWVDKEKNVFVVLLTNRVHPNRSNNKLANYRPKIHDAVIRAIEYF